jgi:hypothetical protein
LARGHSHRAARQEDEAAELYIIQTVV